MEVVILSPVGGVASQFLDNNGNPLSGGLLYTYQAGTTTPHATYTSAAGTTAHTNPIELNAAGRVQDSGEIWLANESSYKFVLKTAGDATIATYDDIFVSTDAPSQAQAAAYYANVASDYADDAETSALASANSAAASESIFEVVTEAQAQTNALLGLGIGSAYTDANGDLIMTYNDATVTSVEINASGYLTITY